MKQMIKWFLKYIDVINTFLLINAIALLILDFGIKINTSTVNILLAIAGITSTFFLYLAFRESKKANDLKVYEPVFNELNNRVIEKELKSKTRVFADEHQLLVNTALKTNESTLEFIFYSDFIDGFVQVNSLIKARTKYCDYIKLLDDKTSVTVPMDLFDVEELQRAALILKITQGGLLLIIMNYIEIYFIYDSIHSSSLLSSQKKVLINKLNGIVDREFFYVIKSLRNIRVTGDEYDDELCECCKELRDFQYFTLLGESTIVKYTSDLEYISTEFDYTKFRDQY